MANLLSNTTIGGYQSIHTGNIGSYALTSVPANVITTSGGQTIAGTTYFSGGESLNVYGIRGRFTNEYMHLYNKVGIGHPSGWGQGEGNTPVYGLSTYGGINIAYAYDGSAIINTYTRINKNWGGGDYGTEAFTIRGTYPSITLRSTNHDSKWLIHHASELQFYYGASADSNAWSNVFSITTNGNLYMAWAGGYISDLLNAKQNASTAITTSNIGSQSVASASQVSGVSVSAAEMNRLKTTLGVTSLPYSCDITVNGDANTFYAVQFWGGDQDVWRRIIIKRGYGETAPWDPIGTGVHHGGLLLDWEGNFGGWGGAEYADRLRVFNQSYTDVCADMFIYSHAMGYIFMLRGGGAVYHLFSDQAINGFYQAGAPDILYSASTLSYDDAWSGTNQYDVYAPTPLTLGQVNSSRIDGLRTKKQSLLDGRYLRQGVDIGSITNISASNFMAANAFYLNSQSYYLNSTNGGIYTNARFETASNLVVQGNSYLGNGNGDEVHINDILRVGATDSGDAHFYFGEGGSAGSDYGSHWYWDSGYRFTWYTRNAGTDSTLFYYDTNSLSYITWGRSISMNTNSIDYTGQLHFSGGTRFQSVDTHYLKFKTDATDYGSIQVRDANETLRGHLGYFDANGFGLLNSSGSWGIRLNPGSAETLLFHAGNERLRTDSQGAYVTGRLDVSNYIYTPQHIIAKNIQGPYQVLNLDSIKEPGLYQYDGGIGGTQPAGTNWSNVKTIEIGSDNRYSQFVMPYSNSRIFYRIKIDAGWQSYVELVTSGNIGSQSVSYASTAGALSSMNISQFTNNSGYLTSLPSHNHDDRYYTETESDGRYAYKAGAAGQDFSVDKLSSYHLRNHYSVSTNHSYGMYFDNDLSTAYGIFRESGAWDHPYPDLRIAFHTGIKLGANSSYQGIKFYTDYDMVTQVMSVNNGSDPLGAGNVYVNNSLQAGSSLRAPIFYDSADTNYYLDPNSTSRLDTVNANTLRSYGNVYTDGNFGHGLVGLYNSTRYQGVFAMGDSYKLTADGTGTGTLYGIAWTHTNVGGQSKSGLGHQALFMDNGVTQTAIGSGIWTAGLITTTSYGTSANWNTAYSWGNHASAGYLTGITSGQVTGALGYTPYNSSNPSGYITSGDTVAGLNTTYLGTATSNIGSSYTRVIRNENGAGGAPNYAPILHVAAGDTMWQIAGAHAGQTTLVWRSGYNGGWGTPWWTIYHSGNFTDNSSNWNTAYGWGNHASAGYVTSSALSSYLPLSGGTMSGHLNVSYNIASPSNYYSGLQAEIMATSGTAGIALHRSGYSHVGIYHDSINELKFNFNGGTPILPATAGTLWGSGNLTNLNQLSNGPGYITGYTETDTLNSVTSRGNTTSNSVRFGTHVDLSPTGSAFRFYDGTTFRGGFGLDSWGHSGSDANLVLYVNGDNTLFFSTAGTKRASLSSSAFNSLVALQQSGNQVLHAGNYTSYSPSLTGSGASGTWSINVTGSAGSASTAGSATNLYGAGGSTIRSSSVGTSYTANYQVRENDGGYGNTNIDYAPQLAFHWGNVVASSIMMEASGRMAIRNNPGTGYENFIAAVIYSSGYGDSTQWNTAYSWGNHASAGYQSASTAINTSNIGSQSVSYAATAGSAPNAGNVNDFYNVTAGNGYGLKFWNSDNYKISMGASSLYYYGPVTDYSIKMQMNDSDTGRGFTWGRLSYAPIAALNSTSGDMEIAGYFKSYGYRGNGNVGGTGSASWHPDGIYCGSTMWQYGAQYKNNTGIYNVSEMAMHSGPTLSIYNSRNLIVRALDNNADVGILGQKSGGGFAFQIYGTGSSYGFLNGTWAAWDIRKAVNGAMYMNDNDSYYLQTNGTSNFYALNIQGNAVVHAGNIGSQSVSYATTAGTANAVAWTNVSSRPTALSQFSNDLGNYGGFLTSLPAHDHDRVFLTDSRGASRAPSYYDQRYAQWDFQNISDTGAGGDGWHGLLTVAKWFSYDASHRQEQLAFTGDDLKRRTATSDSAWGSWKTIIDTGNVGSQSVNYANSAGSASTAGSATTAQQLTKFGDIYGQDWNSYYVSGKLIVSNALGHSGANRPNLTYDYGVALSYGETGGPLLQMYFPENSGNIGTIFRKGTYRTGWNGNWSTWKTLVEQEGNLCTIVGGNGTGLEVHGNVGYNQDPLTYFLIRGQADTSWKALKIRLTGDAGGQDIEFRRIAENGTDARMWYIPRGANTVNFDYPIVQPSDSRLKDNITPISTPVDKIKSLRGVEFDWNSGEQVGTHDVGLIAQDVEAVLPEAVTTQEDGYKNLAYAKVIPLLVEAMKEQQAMIEALKAEIELLKNK
jgi:hypothetical protein